MAWSPSASLAPPTPPARQTHWCRRVAAVTASDARRSPGRSGDGLAEGLLELGQPIDRLPVVRRRETGEDGREAKLAIGRDRIRDQARRPGQVRAVAGVLDAVRPEALEGGG